jgi:hypothetical protein
MKQEELKRIFDFWMLISSLNLAKYAITELETYKMSGLQKSRYNNLRNNISNFLNIQTSEIKKSDRNALLYGNFDNVGLMAEAIGNMTQIPTEQYDWYLNECNKLVHAAANRQKLAENE